MNHHRGNNWRFQPYGPDSSAGLPVFGASALRAPYLFLVPLHLTATVFKPECFVSSSNCSSKCLTHLKTLVAPNPAGFTLLNFKKLELFAAASELELEVRRHAHLCQRRRRAVASGEVVSPSGLVPLGTTSESPGVRNRGGLSFTLRRLRLEYTRPRRYSRSCLAPVGH